MDGFEHLLKSQLAQVGRLVGASGIQPREFHWRDGAYESYRRTPELRHAPSNFRFQFTYSNHDSATGYGGPRRAGRHHAKFTPGATEEWEEHSFLEWHQVLGYVEQWLQNLARELSSESFWEAVARVGSGLSGHSEGEVDEPLEEEERSEIRSALDEALRRIEELENLHEEELAFVRAEFAELKDNLGVLNRRGWAKMALGTFVNIGAREIIPQGTMKRAWEHLLTSFETLPGMLPPGG